MSFYEETWFILNKSPFGIKIFDYHLPQQPTLSDMTDYELNFSIKIEEMLSKIDEPVMRQIVVEVNYFLFIHKSKANLIEKATKILNNNVN